MATSTSHDLVFVPLGSGREVGRSCHLLKFKGKTIMLDCGIHPGRKNLDALPFFDAIEDPSDIDLILITHFHLDHVASLPYFVKKYKYTGRIFMTHPTKMVANMLLRDYVRVSRSSGGNQEAAAGLYDDADVKRCMDMCEKIDFHQQLEVEGIRFTPYVAGHVLGAAMFLIEISNAKILYTGDFSRENDRHLLGAECNPEWRPDVLIMESTFGIQIHESREERETRFLDAVERVVRRGGKCLIPVFSLGRAQELLLILEEHWNNDVSLQSVPVYHASRLATKSLSVYQRFIDTMNSEIRTKFASEHGNPWVFKHISDLSNPNDFDEPGAAVVMASPGMMQSGASRKLFERWCGDPRNGVIIAGYCVDGTLAYEVLSQPKEITSQAGRILPLRCEVKYVSFTAHADYKGSHTFVSQLLPRHVVFVHGEQNAMLRLKVELQKSFSDREARGEMDFFNPKNGHNVVFTFTEELVVRALGGMASSVSKRARVEDGRPVSGLLVSRNFEHRLVENDELEVFTPLTATTIVQRLHAPFHSTAERLESVVSKLFKFVKEDNSIRVTLGDVTLTHDGRLVCLEWQSSPVGDTVADALLSCLMQAETGVEAVRLSACRHDHGDGHEAQATAAVTAAALAARFGESSVACGNDGSVVLTLQNNETITISPDGSITAPESVDSELVETIEGIADRTMWTTVPL